jgi:hypothetical protein
LSYTIGVLVVAFLPPNLIFIFLSRKRRLNPSPFLSLKLHKYLFAGLFISFLAVIAYGYYVWPAGSLRPVGSTFVDKSGEEYTEQQFNSFQRWEVSLLTVGGIFAIFTLVSTPLFRSRHAVADSNHEA